MPGVPPVIVPDVDPIGAIVLLLLVHVPPVTASVSVVVSPEHTCVVPAIAVGSVFTVTAAVAWQPVARV
jgi:hypothetical protein